MEQDCLENLFSFQWNKNCLDLTWRVFRFGVVSVPACLCEFGDSQSLFTILRLHTLQGWGGKLDPQCHLSASGTELLYHEPAYTLFHMVISGYLDHQSTRLRLSASELLLFVSVVLVLINTPPGIPNRDDIVS